jgi:hypothetical protein
MSVRLQKEREKVVQPLWHAQWAPAQFSSGAQAEDRVP